MFGILGIVLAGGVAAVLGLAARRPAQFRIARSTSIRASPARIYEELQDFHRWPGWSPWEKLDPDLQRTYSGAAAGPGAAYEWQGRKAGAGRMEIVQADAPSSLVIKLDFTKPFKASNTTRFSLSPAGESTDVTWEMTGPNLFMGKVMSLFINMDKMVGTDFEKGLDSLKQLTQASPDGDGARL